MFNDMKYVWAPDGKEGFLLGTVKDIGTENITVQIRGTNDKVVTAPYKRVFPAEDDINKNYDDNCALMYLNEATLLHNLRLRYKEDKIYTYVANILIAVNPYGDIAELYSKETIMKYKGKSLGTLPPHVFAIADKTYRDMKVMNQSQSIIVSGESGAGKTESTKYIIRYLTESYGQGISGDLEKRIVETNPLLEAFGNAKTLRNLNSSRFGKYVEVHFGKKAIINGAFVSHYLLEKTRICTQSPGERNYHVFYRMCAGAPNEMKNALKLKDASHFNYLNKGSLKESGINDVNDFKLLDGSMDSVGITAEQKSNIFQIAATVLHLGNIEFQENLKDKNGGCQIDPSSDNIVNDVAKLLGVHPGEVKMCLTTRVMMTTKGGAMGTLYKVPLKPDAAAAGRDALAKAIYSKLFDYIVSLVNKCFPFENSENYIGVLDIAGFEFFEANGFEQFCINYCNEKLQQFFNERILKEEQALYKKEGLGLKDVTYTDNQDCIELFENKITGLMDLLDEEMKFPAPSDLHFTVEAHQKNKNHFRLAIPRKSPLPIHRTVKDDEGFLIRHFAGAVCYQTAGFLSRNNDALHENLEMLLQESSYAFIKNLFPPPPKVPTNKKRNSKKLAFESIGKKFRSQLSLLMSKLRDTGSNFIRCIKPNDQLKKRDFEGGQILSQLQCAGMVAVLHLMQEGYPSRTAFINLYEKYKQFLPPNLVKLDPRTFSHALFHAVGMDSNDFKFGLTKVFFRAGKFAEFDQIMRSDPEGLSVLIKKVARWIVQNRWKRAIWCAVSVQKLANKIKFRRDMLIRIQKTARMFLAVRKHKPRYKGLLKIKTLEQQIEELSKIATSLKSDKETYQKKVNEVACEVEKVKKQIKSTIMKQNEINILYTNLVQKIHTLLKAMHSEKSAQEEQEKQRLAKIQEQMLIEKKKQEEEERRKKEEEEKRKERMALEAKQKEEAMEVERKRKLEEEQSKALAAKLNEEKVEAELQTSQQESQKQRDYELALRLAADPATMVSDELVKLKRNIPNDGSADNKFDYLRKWTYAELRDTINTSCDLEILEACRIEFHRRLKVYHAWRKQHMKNKKTESQRAPVEIIQNSETTSETPKSVSLTNPFRKYPVNIQRFFRVPFSKPSDQYRYDYRKSGWWYAHFDGEWVARQIELHHNGALLLIAGRNDNEICELSLTETRLLERPGAEITADEFNKVWMYYGGNVDQIFISKSKR